MEEFALMAMGRPAGDGIEEVDEMGLVQRSTPTRPLGGRTRADGRGRNRNGKGRDPRVPDINLRERSRMTGLGLARIIVAAPSGLRQELGHEVVGALLTRIRSQARRILVAGIALRESGQLGTTASRSSRQLCKSMPRELRALRQLQDRWMRAEAASLQGSPTYFEGRLNYNCWEPGS